MRRTCAAVAAVMAVSGLAQADQYFDAAGDLAGTFAGFGHLDILDVTITNDATTLTIDILVGGDLDGANWGKYALGIDTGGATDNSNPWGRNIDWARGIDYWVATWADDGGSGIGGQVWNWDGAGWNENAGVAGDDSQHAAGHQIFSIALADLGLAIGDSFDFDVITTAGGGGDPGVDHLSRATEATPDWGTTSVSGTFRTYTVIPTPGVIGILGLGGLVALRRRR